MSDKWAIRYGRFSSKKQELGDSERRQDEGFAAFVQSSKLDPAPVAFTYWDKGQSGYKGHHLKHDFGRLLADCEAKRFPPGSIIWFEDMDRFGRMKQREVQNQWGKITDAGYGIHIKSEGKTFWANTPEMETLSVILKAILAHEYSAKLSGRMKDANQAKRERKDGLNKFGKKNGTCPQWLTLSADGKTYVRSDQWDAIKGACLDSIAGFGRLEIGAKSIGKRWNLKPTGLTRIFRSRTLIGEYQPMKRGADGKEKAGQPIENYYPALLTPDEFHQLQSALDSRKLAKKGRGRATVNLFTGLCVNALGQNMALGYARATRVLKPHKTGLGFVAGKSIHYEVIENALLDLFIRVKPEDLYPKTANDDSAKLKNVEAEIADRKATIEKLIRQAVETNNPDLLAFNQGNRAKVAELEKERDTLQRALATSKTDNLAETRELIGNVMEGLDGAALHDFRVRLQTVIARLVVRIEIDVIDTRSANLVVKFSGGAEIAIGGETVKRGKIQASIL